MARIKTGRGGDKTYPNLSPYWRRALSVSLSDLEAELSISLHHPLQTERAMNALSRHVHLVRGMIGKDLSERELAQEREGEAGGPQ